MKMFRKAEGFTLVELMVVVLIIGILVAIAIPVFLNTSATAKLNSCYANQRTIEGAIQSFNSSSPTGTGSTAVNLTGTGTGFNSIVSDSTYATLKAAPKCPAATSSNTYYIGTTMGVTGDQAAATWASGHMHY